MQVLLIGSYYEDSFSYHIADTFEHMGHHVFRYDAKSFQHPAKGASLFPILSKGAARIRAIARNVPLYQRIVQRDIHKLIGGASIDLIVVTYDFLWPETAAFLKRRYGAPIALWFPDHVGNFSKSMFLHAKYDFLFFKEPFAVQILRHELGLNAHYLPEACNPRRHHRVVLGEKERDKYGCELTTAGAMHAARVSFFRHLDQYHMKIWGPPPALWIDLGTLRPFVQMENVWCEEKCAAFLGAKIVINNLYPSEFYGVNCRTFEAAAAGAFQLISWRPGLQQLFREGEEIVSFRSIKELKQKIDHYLVHEEERLEIAARAERRAHAEHTYEHRLQLLIDTVFDRGRGFPMPMVFHGGEP